ncbi:MAG: hypothetical protein AAGB93_10310 [Planctomycetota bacterium]
MTERERPHLAWTGLVVVALVGLAVVAYWMWSRQAFQGGDPGGGSGTMVTDGPLDGSLAAIEAAIERGAFDEAARLVEEARARLGPTEHLDALAARIALRSDAFRSTLRPIEFRVERLEQPDGEGALWARVRLDGRAVLATDDLAPSLDDAGDGGHANLFTVRTSFDRGCSLELVRSGGMFSGDEVVFGPVEVGPLADVEGGLLELEDPDAPGIRVVTRYRTSPFEPGLTLDEPPSIPPAGANESALVAAIVEALSLERVEAAGEALSRLTATAPAHPDLAFLGESIAERRESLMRNLRTVRFVAVEAACDPRLSGAPWAAGGRPSALRARIEADGETAAKATGGPTVPFLLPGSTLDPPRGNVLRVTARGDAPLVLVVADASPTIGARRVGSIDLPVTLADLPKGSGTLVVEREPTVLVLPEDDENRLRRIVLRWTVEEPR